MRAQNFGVRIAGPSWLRARQVGEDLLAAGRRLDGVTIEQLGWSAFIAKYDRPGALFYLSLCDRSEVRQIFTGFVDDEDDTHYGLAGKGSKTASEVIITSGAYVPAFGRVMHCENLHATCTATVGTTSDD